MRMGGGDGSEMGSLMEEKGKNLRTSIIASFTPGTKTRATATTGFFMTSNVPKQEPCI